MRTPTPLVLALLAAGCTSDPIVDMAGVNQVKYDNDLAACREYADQVNVATGTAGGAVAGAAVGAALGAVVGAITGSPGTGAAIGAATGGTTGGVSGASSGGSRRDRVVRNCLRERGYSVLD
ncbi:MAG: glycine zipper family protein [Rhodospirillales bacterium]